MRLLACGVLILGLAAGACNRANTAGPAGAPASNAAAEANRDAGASPVATAGHTESSRAAVREVTIPAGTRLPIVLDSTVGSETSRVEQPIQAHLSQPITINGETVVPAGSRVTGVVTDAKRSGKVKGRAHIAIRFDTLVPRGSDERYQVTTSAVGRTAPATKKKDALEIGAPAAGGAVIGGLIGGKKGALIGTAAGGGAGTAVVLSTRGKEVHLNKGAALTLRLSQPLTIRIKS
jgi:hypothetical protein